MKNACKCFTFGTTGTKMTKSVTNNSLAAPEEVPAVFSNTVAYCHLQFVFVPLQYPILVGDMFLFVTLDDLYKS